MFTKMNILKLNKYENKIFSTNDIADILSISNESAKVTAHRYLKKGLLIRLKRDLYITTDKFNNLNENELFKLANLIQVPSYISLTTALSYYDVSTQQLQGIIESTAIKRTKSVQAGIIIFNFIKVKKNFYTGFIQKDNIFIATPEKALADSIYLSSMGRYNTDFDAIDFAKIDKALINKFLQQTNNKALTLWNKLCKSYKI